MANINIIVAHSDNYAIGKNNSLLWHNSDDLKLFKYYTEGKPIIMGRKTWDSLPKKPLPNRINIVVTNQKNFEHTPNFSSLESAIEYAKTLNDEIFIIGGELIYRQAIYHANYFYVSKFKHKQLDADSFFPPIDYNNSEVIYQKDYGDFVFFICKFNFIINM